MRGKEVHGGGGVSAEADARKGGGNERGLRLFGEK